MTHVSEYATGPSDPVWREATGALERGRYRIERAVDREHSWVLRILRPGERDPQPAPTGSHATMTGAKAWATHYDVESLRHLKIFRHGALSVIVLLGALAVYNASLPADSSQPIAGVVLALVLLQLGLRELVLLGSMMLGPSSAEDLEASTTVVDRAVGWVIRSIMRPVDEPPERVTHVRIVDDWGDRGRG